MRKHRSLGEMISTATFLGAECSYFYTVWNYSTWDSIYVPMLDLPRLCFVFWVGFASPSQI